MSFFSAASALPVTDNSMLNAISKYVIFISIAP
jgi:hypothetical protein